jgi:hypothetical protein
VTRAALIHRVRAALLFVALVGACANGPSIRIGEVPVGLGRAGLTGEPIEPSGLISGERALAVAQAQAPVREGPNVRVDAYLLRLSHANAAETGVGLVDRAAWLVWYSGLEIRFGGPSPAGAEQLGPHVAHFAYVIVDAHSGAPIESGFVQ